MFPNKSLGSFGFDGLFKTKQQREALEAAKYYKNLKFQDVYQFCFNRIYPRSIDQTDSMRDCFKLYSQSIRTCEAALATCVRDRNAQKNQSPTAHPRSS